MRVSRVIGHFVIVAAAAAVASHSLRAAPDCAASAQALDRFRSDFDLDRDVMSRAQDLADSAARQGGSPSIAQLTTVAEDAADDFDQAAGQIDEAAQAIAQHLDPRTAQDWNRALGDFRAARNQFRAAITPEKWSAPRAGAGPAILPLATVYGDATTTTNAVAPLLNLIGSGALGPGAVSELGNWIFVGAPDKNPPTNKLHVSSDPYLPMMPGVQVIGANARRMNAHRGILGGLRALQAHNVASARQSLGAGRAELNATAAPMQQLQSAVNQCAQPPQRPAATQPPPPAPAASAPKHGISGKTLTLLSLAAGGGTALALFHPNPCCPPPPDDWSLVSYTTFVCSGSQCSGSMTIHIPVAVSSGRAVADGVDPGGNQYIGEASGTPGTIPGTVQFTMTRPYGGLHSCYSSITRLGVFDRTTDGPALWATDVSVPVSCQ